MAKKIICMLLALSMMLTVLAACNNDPVVDETPDDGQQQEDIQGNDEVEEPFDSTLKLVVDGVSDYVIVRGENAYISEVTASTELQKYLKQISGVEIPIVTDATEPVAKEIVVGKTNREADGEFNRDELGDDGLVIKSNGQKLFLVGGEQRGTLYSVYTFLEEYLGCRFYAADYEKIPETTSISLEPIAENKQIPVFEVRNSFWYEVYDHALSAKLKINGERGRGVIPDELGGSVDCAGTDGHSLYPLAEMTGGHMNNEPCLTSEDVYNTVLKNVRAKLAANPTLKYVSVSQNDAVERFGCECDNCMAVYNKYGCWTGLYLEFVNRIAREIKDEYSDVMVHTFAYTFTRPVPVGLEIEDNVAIQLCTIESNQRFPIEDYDVYTDPEDYDVTQDFEILLKEWGEVCDYLAVWNYTTEFWNYQTSLPGFEAYRENVRLFADNNVKDLFMQGAYQSESGEFGELKGYIIARLLWDPYMSDEEYWAMIDEFLIDYYGPGGVKLREYIDLLQAETESNGILELNGAKPKYGPAFGLSNYFEDKVYSVTFRSEGYPEAITEDVIRNYKDFDWLPYINYYKGYVDEDSILGTLVTEGRRLFNEAMEMAEDDRQRVAIDKCAIQIDVMEAYYTCLKLRKGKYWGKDIVRNYSWANPGVFTADEEKQYMKDVQDYLIQVVEDMCSEYNKNLSEKLDKYQCYNIRENYRKAHGEVIKFVTLGSDCYFENFFG